MKNSIEKAVKSAIRRCLDDDGLEDTIMLSYQDIDYDLDSTFLPMIQDPSDDDEYDKLHTQAEETARSIFNEIRRQLRIAQATIQSALSI